MLGDEFLRSLHPPGCYGLKLLHATRHQADVLFSSGSRAHHQILELRENNALLSQRSSVAGHALELSYPLSGIHSIH